MYAERHDLRLAAASLFPKPCERTYRAGACQAHRSSVNGTAHIYPSFPTAGAPSAMAFWDPADDVAVHHGAGNTR